jgi:outer membrane protein TolC
MKRSLIKYKLALLCLLPLTVAAKAPLEEVGVVRLSLQDCIDYALRNSDTIKNARLAIQKQQASNNQIKASALPQINGAGQLNDFVNPQQSLIPLSFFTQKVEDGDKFATVQFSPKYSANATASGSQTLFDGSLLVALKARKTIIEAVTLASKLNEEGVKYNIQKAYYAIVIGQQQSRTLAASLATARDMVHDVHVLYETGFAEKIEVNRSEVQLANLETDSIRAASLLETGEQALKYAMGMDITQPVELTDTSLDNNATEALELITEQLDYNKRTEISLANTAIRLNEYNVKRYQLSGLPTLKASGNMTYMYGSNKFSDLTNFKSTYFFYSLVGLELNVPIFSGFRRKNQVAEARIDVEMAKNRLHLLKQSLDFQTAQSQTTLRNALLAANRQKRNLELANSVVDLARKKYKAGVGSNLEVNQAQTELLAAQNSYYSIMLDLVNSQADVMRALGQFQ